MIKSTHKMAGLGIYWILWIACIIGSLAVMPYIQYLGTFPPEVSIWKILFFHTLQSAAVFGVICWLSSKIVPRTDLRPFRLENPRERIIYPALIFGVPLSLILFLLQSTVFAGSALGSAIIRPPSWAGLLASFYGAVNEEVLLRLFLFTLVYFLFTKVFKYKSDKRSIVLWSANILVALFFGAGHLPAAFKVLGTLSSFEIYRILLLNAIPSLVFGWLYWSRGLWTAMAAHLALDLMVHVL